jgi:hypothetical protein
MPRIFAAKLTGTDPNTHNEDPAKKDSHCIINRERVIE